MTWPTWLPKPFWWDWLPSAVQNELTDDIETYGPPFIDAIVNLATIALLWDAPVIAAWGTMAKELWEQYVGGTPTAYTPPAYTPSPAPLPDGVPWTDDAPPASAFEGAPTLLRSGEAIAFHETAAASALLTVHTARMSFPESSWRTWTDEYVSTTNELEVNEDCDGVVIDIDTVPEKLGGLSFAEELAVIPRLGWMVFHMGTYVDERQKVELVRGVYVPRNMSRCWGVRVHCKPGTTFTVKPFNLTLPGA